MAANKALERAVQFTVAAPAADNAGQGPDSGEPLMLGTMAAVAESSYTPPTGVPTGNISMSFEGAYFLNVTAATALSPLTGHAINPGDKVYADGGTRDAVTNVLYGFTLDANTGGVYFGNALDALLSGVTGVVRVRLKVTG